MPKELPRTINLLEPTLEPKSSWDRIYDWIVKIGKYLIIGVEGIVLVAFVFRFIYDRKNNDLIESINAKVNILNEWKPFELEVRSTQNALNSLDNMLQDQYLLSPRIQDLNKMITPSVSIESYSINTRGVSLSCKSSNYEAIEKMEQNFNANEEYDNVGVSLVRSGGDSEIEFVIRADLVDVDNMR